jgi:hypothetical protein
MKLNGSDVVIGDSVYCVMQGHGRVTFVDTSYFNVSFSGKEIAYVENGYSKLYRKKTLFWFEPFYIEPPKDAKLNNIINGFMRSSYNFLGEVINAAKH